MKENVKRQLKRRDPVLPGSVLRPDQAQSRTRHAGRRMRCHVRLPPAQRLENKFPLSIPRQATVTTVNDEFRKVQAPSRRLPPVTNPPLDSTVDVRLGDMTAHLWRSHRRPRGSLPVTVSGARHGVRRGTRTKAREGRTFTRGQHNTTLANNLTFTYIYAPMGAFNATWKRPFLVENELKRAQNSSRQQ